MTITSRDGLIAALAVGQEIDFLKAPQTSVAGRYSSLFRTAGRPQATTTAPGTTGSALNNATPGALPFVSPPTGQQAQLAQLGLSSSVACSLLAVDRLVETGGLSGNVTGAQTVNSVALPSRLASGIGVGLWLEVYTATGATASTVTASYTNSAGQTGRTATLIGSLPASAAVGTLIPFTLQQGDVGVQSVQSVSLATATGTVGSIGVTLQQRIAECPVQANNGAVLSWADLGLPTIGADACLALVELPSTTTTGTLLGSAVVVAG